MRQLRLEGEYRQVADGFPAAQRAIDSGLMFGVPWHAVDGGLALLQTGRPEHGLQLLDEALAQILTPGWEERGYLAEIHRVRAALLREADAEAEFRASLQVAREQEARWLELRAAMDYARFMHGRGRSVEAVWLLRPVYAWFTEGFDTRDLIDAKALLDELGR